MGWLTKLIKKKHKPTHKTKKQIFWEIETWANKYFNIII